MTEEKIHFHMTYLFSVKTLYKDVKVSQEAL
jgi:hypothetical protein